MRLSQKEYARHLASAPRPHRECPVCGLPVHSWMIDSPVERNGGGFTRRVCCSACKSEWLESYPFKGYTLLHDGMKPVVKGD